MACSATFDPWLPTHNLQRCPRQHGHIAASSNRERKWGAGLVPFKGQTWKSQVSPPPDFHRRECGYTWLQKRPGMYSSPEPCGPSVTGDERKSVHRDSWQLLPKEHLPWTV